MSIANIIVQNKTATHLTLTLLLCLFFPSFTSVSSFCAPVFCFLRRATPAKEDILFLSFEQRGGESEMCDKQWRYLL
jgi:hypothetical protein